MMPSKSIALPRNGGEKGPAKGKRERQIAAIRRLRACREFIPIRETSLQKTSTSSSNLAAVPSLWPFSTLPDVSGDCAAPLYAFFPSSNALVVISRPVIPTVEDRVSPAPEPGFWSEHVAWSQRLAPGQYTSAGRPSGVASTCQWLGQDIVWFAHSPGTRLCQRRRAEPQ